MAIVHSYVTNYQRVAANMTLMTANARRHGPVEMTYGFSQQLGTWDDLKDAQCGLRDLGFQI